MTVPKAPLIFLDEKLVLSIHQRQIAEHGGKPGLRDAGLLTSALDRPQNILAYREGADVFALAAAYAFGIIKNHPFVDGNKRVGYIAMRLFLKLNGIDFVATPAEKYSVIIGLAAGNISEKELADWLRSVSGLSDSQKKAPD